MREGGGNVVSVLCGRGRVVGVDGLRRGLLAPGLLARVDLVAEAERHSLGLGADPDVTC